MSEAKARKLLEELLWAVDNDTGHEPSVSFLARKADEVREFLNPIKEYPGIDNLKLEL